MKLWKIFVLSLMILASVGGALATDDNPNTIQAGTTSWTVTEYVGIFFNYTNTTSRNMTKIIKYAGTVTGITCSAINVSNSCAIVATGTSWSGDYCTLSTEVTMNYNETWAVAVSDGGGAFTYGYSNSPPADLVSYNAVWENGYYRNDEPCGTVRDLGAGRFRGTRGFVSEVFTPPSFTFSLNVQNVVNESFISGFCVDLENGTTTSYCNSTGNTITHDVEGVYNITWRNITAGHSSPVYYNTTQQNVNATYGTTLTGSTTQAYILLNATQLFLNTSIASFNTTNNKINNLTTSGTLLLKANNGTNNVQTYVLGNYSQNHTFTVNTPLTTSTATATGFYDTKWTIGAANGSTSIASFNTTAINTSIVSNTSETTTNAIVFNLLQGYSYQFFMNATGFSLANVTLPTNASTHTYNFTLLTANTFNISFYNESSNTLLNETVYVTLISDSFAANYTTNTGYFNVSLLTPDSFEIQYYWEPDVPRSYFTTLTSQSYLNLRLYTLDEDVSSLYLLVLVDQDGTPISNATVSMLRYYVDINGYRTVEMAKTDTNGQAVFRVVPNIINYRFLFQQGTQTFTTDPSKLTNGQDTYTFNIGTNPLQSLNDLPNVFTNLTYLNATQTFTFTWADTQGLVSGACLTITKKKAGNLSTESDSCSTGATGSLIYTVTDLNETVYSASATLNTNTEFSNIPFGPVMASFTTTSLIFAGVALLLTLLLFLAFTMYSDGAGAEGVAIGGLVALGIVAYFNILALTWVGFVGIVIVVGIIMYKSRT